MKSLRMETLASFIEPDDKVIDIGCDHAYLPIFLVQKKLCQKVIASDINKNALQMAQKNIKKNHLEKDIKTFLSNGLTDILDKDIDTVVMAGMGSHTILEILKTGEGFDINKIIIQSNTDLPILRKNLRKQGYYLQKEKVVYENHHYYLIGVYTHEYNHLSLHEKWFGIFDASNHDYYLHLYNELLQIEKKLSFKKNTFSKTKILFKKILLKTYL